MNQTHMTPETGRRELRGRMKIYVNTDSLMGGDGTTPSKSGPHRAYNSIDQAQGAFQQKGAEIYVVYPLHPGAVYPYGWKKVRVSIPGKTRYQILLENQDVSLEAAG